MSKKYAKRTGRSRRKSAKDLKGFAASVQRAAEDASSPPRPGPATIPVWH